MAAPWEKYQQGAAPSSPASGGSKPWERFAAQPKPRTAETIRAEYDALPWYAQAGRAADDIVRAVANGLTFNMADRLAGLTNPEGVEGEWRKNEEARARAGLAYDAAGMAGGIRTALSAGNSGLTLMGRFGTGALTGLPGVAARTGLASVEGAGYGALDAAGSGRDVASGAKVGALGGAAGNLVGEAVQAVRGAFTGRDPRDYLARAAAGDSLDPVAAQAALDDLGPAATLADLGPNMQAQTAALSTRPGENQAIVRRSLMERQAAAPQRITDAVDSAMGQKLDVTSLVDDIVSARKQMADPLYKSSRDVPVTLTDDIKQLLNRPAAKEAISEARTAMANRGESFSLDKPTVGTLDAIKKSLDDMISPAVREGKNNRASYLMELKDAIVRIADDASPDYAAARKVFSDASQVKNALETGSSLFKNSIHPEELRKMLGQMDDASLEAFTTGARRQVADIMGTARNDAAAAKALFDKGYNQEKLRMVIGDDAAEELLRVIGAEKRFASTANRAMGGSDTIPKGLAQSLISGAETDVGMVRSLLNLNFGDAMLAAGNKVLGPIAKNRDERINAEIARLLMGRDISALEAPIRNSQLTDDVARALLGAGTGISNELPRPLELTVTPGR